MYQTHLTLMATTKALVLGAIFEAMGAITMGSSVAKTISKGVIDPNAYNADGCEGTATFALGMLCVQLKQAKNVQ